jgi:hypothetical protein
MHQEGDQHATEPFSLGISFQQAPVSNNTPSTLSSLNHSSWSARCPTTTRCIRQRKEEMISLRCKLYVVGRSSDSSSLTFPHRLPQFIAVPPRLRAEQPLRRKSRPGQFSGREVLSTSVSFEYSDTTHLIKSELPCTLSTEPEHHRRTEPRRLRSFSRAESPTTRRTLLNRLSASIEPLEPAALTSGQPSEEAEKESDAELACQRSR